MRGALGIDPHEKRPIYAREDIAHLRLIDPINRTLEAFELHDGQWLLIASAKDDEPVSIHPFGPCSRPRPAPEPPGFAKCPAVLSYALS